MSRSSYLRKLWHIRHTHCQLDHFLWEVGNFKQPFGGLRDVRFSFCKNCIKAGYPYCKMGQIRDRKISRISRISQKSRNFPARENFLFYSSSFCGFQDCNCMVSLRDTVHFDHVTSYFLLCPLLYGVALSDSVHWRRKGGGGSRGPLGKWSLKYQDFVKILMLPGLHPLETHNNINYGIFRTLRSSQSPIVCTRVTPIFSLIFSFFLPAHIPEILGLHVAHQGHHQNKTV